MMGDVAEIRQGAFLLRLPPGLPILPVGEDVKELLCQATDGTLTPATSAPFQVAAAALDRFFVDDGTLPATDGVSQPQDVVAMLLERPLLTGDLEAMLPHLAVSRAAASGALRQGVSPASGALPDAPPADASAETQQAGFGLAGLALALFEAYWTEDRQRDNRTRRRQRENDCRA